MKHLRRTIPAFFLLVSTNTFLTTAMAEGQELFYHPNHGDYRPHQPYRMPPPNGWASEFEAEQKQNQRMQQLNQHQAAQPPVPTDTWSHNAPDPQGTHQHEGHSRNVWAPTPYGPAGRGSRWGNRGGWSPWNGGGMPWGNRRGGFMNKDGFADAWDDMLNAPSEMGDMPGGWQAPTVDVPNPVDIGDEFERNARDMPDQMNNLYQDNRRFNREGWGW